MIKKTFLAVCAGVLLIFFTRLSVIIGGILYNRYLISNYSVEQFKQILENPPMMSMAVYWSGVFLQYLSYFAAGFMAVNFLRKPGWKIGLYTGIAWIVFSNFLIVLFTSIVWLLPGEFLSRHQDVAVKIKQEQLSGMKYTLTGNLPQKALTFGVIIGLSALGGVLASRKNPRKNPRK